MNKVTLKKQVFICSFLLFSFVFSFSGAGQDMMGKTGMRRLWEGLKEKQPADRMPEGKAPFQTAQRKQERKYSYSLNPHTTRRMDNFRRMGAGLLRAGNGIRNLHF